MRAKKGLRVKKRLLKGIEDELKEIKKLKKEVTMNLSETNLVKKVYLVIRSLLQKGVFSPRPENVSIERVGNEPIYPCGRSYGPEGLDLSQLEGAAKKGHFWFSGPIKAIKITIDKGSMQGDIRLRIDKMVFITSLNTLNYQNFETVVKRLKEVAQQVGLELNFQPIGSYDVKLVVSSETFLSVNNVNEFVNKLHILHQSTDGL